MIAVLWIANKLGHVATFPINAAKYQHCSTTSSPQPTPTTKQLNSYWTIALLNPLFIPTRTYLEYLVTNILRISVAPYS